ncbi:MAG TPA: class I SAM-dependent methyltransferase [Bacteroidales bacterium]|nr:class I SAM-dependent methyltransferase [Bacteroidales bacterium]
MDKSIFKLKINLLHDNIFEVAGLAQGNYDAQAVQYDKLISSKLYNRLMWANLPKDYANFNRKAIKANKEGTIADIACGTLSFSADVYASVGPQDLYLCDLSYEMLRIGKERVQRLTSDDSGFTFLRSDALNLPFTDGRIQTLICIGFIHVLDEPTALLKELHRVLKFGGGLYLTSLCTDRKFSARYLNLLHKKGHVSTPKHSSEVIKLVADQGFSSVSSHVKGGMVYITASK